MVHHEIDSCVHEAHINISDYFELRGWAKRFDSTAGEVRRAVAAVGDRAADVESYLHRPRATLDVNQDPSGGWSS
jgi:hypothetical protein